MRSASSRTSTTSTTSTSEEDGYRDKISIVFESQVGSIETSPTGRDLAIATRNGLHILDLSIPYDPPRFLPYDAGGEVAQVQWNPHGHRAELVAQTAKQYAIVYNLRQGGSAAQTSVQYVLEAHLRAVTALDWSPYEPDLLGSCGLDGFLNLWDLRTSTRPAWTASALDAGATTIRFNRRDENILASAHNRSVLVWDRRMQTTPLLVTKGHMSRVCDMDWSYHDSESFVTSSLDRTLRLWNVKLHEGGLLESAMANHSLVAPASPAASSSSVFDTHEPILKSRFTPFGKSILTLPASQNQVHLWSQDNMTQPMPLFATEYNGIQNCAWRARGPINDRQFQLITWSRDGRLRLWPVSHEFLSYCGHPQFTTDNMVLGSDAPHGTFRTIHESGILRSHVRSSLNPNTSLTKASLGRDDSLSDAKNIAESQSQSTHALDKDLSRPTLVDPKSVFSSDNPQPSDNTHVPARTYMFPTPVQPQRAKPADEYFEWLQHVQVAKDPSTQQDPESHHHILGNELARVSKRLPAVHFEKISMADRTCTVSLQSSSFLRINFEFPKGYPRHRALQFSISNSPEISRHEAHRLKRRLTSIVQDQLKWKRPSLEPALRYLLSLHEDHAKMGSSYAPSSNPSYAAAIQPSYDSARRQQPAIPENRILAHDASRGHPFVFKPASVCSVISPTGHLIIAANSGVAPQLVGAHLDMPKASKAGHNAQQDPDLENDSDDTDATSPDGSTFSEKDPRLAHASFTFGTEAPMLSFPDIDVFKTHSKSHEDLGLFPTKPTVLVVEPFSLHLFQPLKEQNLRLSDTLDSLTSQARGPANRPASSASSFVHKGIPDNSPVALLDPSQHSMGTSLEPPPLFDTPALASIAHEAALIKNLIQMQSPVVHTALELLFSLLRPLERSNSILHLGLVSCFLWSSFESAKDLEPPSGDSEAKPSMDIHTSVPGILFLPNASKGQHPHARSSGQAPVSPAARSFNFRVTYNEPPQCMISQMAVSKLELYRLLFADLLLALDLPILRTRVLKMSLCIRAPKGSFEYTLAAALQSLTQSSVAVVPVNPSPSRPSLICVVCKRPVRGLSISCVLCRHAGHLACMQSWLNTYKVCASACACQCIAQRGVNGWFLTER